MLGHWPSCTFTPSVISRIWHAWTHGHRNIIPQNGFTNNLHSETNPRCCAFIAFQVLYVNWNWLCLYSKLLLFDVALWPFVIRKKRSRAVPGSSMLLVTKPSFIVLRPLYRWCTPEWYIIYHWKPFVLQNSASNSFSQGNKLGMVGMFSIMNYQVASVCVCVCLTQKLGLLGIIHPRWPIGMKVGTLILDGA